MKVPFQTVEVFTDRQFGGNPVAVISDARDTLKCSRLRARQILQMLLAKPH
jgi:predicted PhzF superfamily epimerase YddE/YHI9